MSELNTDLLIVGGGVGGCACAIAACSAGLNVVMTEESDWIGGQFTSQATPPDEHGWIESFGCTRSYRQFRERVRAIYRSEYPLTKRALDDPFLNPGNGWVSPLCAEPRVFLRVFEELLLEFGANGKLLILREHAPVAADVDVDNVRGVRFENLVTGNDLTISARFFVDATELGDLLPITGAEFVTGSESRNETGEPSAKEIGDPHNSQAFSMCFAMSNHPGETWTIDRPTSYDFWRGFEPKLNPTWSGKLLSLEGLNPRTLDRVTYNFAPESEPNKAFAGLWTYRRILHKENFTEGAIDSDITLVNYPQIDFLLGDLANTGPTTSLNGGSQNSRQQLIADAKELSLSFLYYLQTELGFSSLKLRPDVVGTKDGLAKAPYVRESRRIKAELTIREQDVSAVCRPGKTRAKDFPDAVGIGFYRIDLHPTVGGDNYVDVESLPFQIPLGALIPQRIENLLPAAKNIGTTHITNGCYRLHPVEWNIGEAVGNLVAYCFQNDLLPRQVRNNARKLHNFQKILVGRGFELRWPEELDLNEGDPHRHAM